MICILQARLLWRLKCKYLFKKQIFPSNVWKPFWFRFGQGCTFLRVQVHRINECCICIYYTYTHTRTQIASHPLTNPQKDNNLHFQIHVNSTYRAKYHLAKEASAQSKQVSNKKDSSVISSSTQMSQGQAHHCRLPWAISKKESTSTHVGALLVRCWTQWHEWLDFPKVKSGGAKYQAIKAAGRSQKPCFCRCSESL